MGKKTPLGQLMAQDEKLLTALEDIIEQVRVWDALGTRKPLLKRLAKHGIKFRKVWREDEWGRHYNWKLG